MTLLDQIKQKKFRSSGLGNILAGINKGLSNSEKEELAKYVGLKDQFQITPKQKEELAKLLGKPKLTDKQSKRLEELRKKAVTPKISDKQRIKMYELITKRDAPMELSSGGISHVREIIEEIIWGRSQNLTAKYLEKGLLCETQSMSLVQRVRKEYMQKNELTFDNHPLMRGTPDYIRDDKIIDIKTSWTRKSFPLMDSKIKSVYYWQLMSYMIMVGVDFSELIYVLVDTPIKLIEDEIRRLSWQLGYTSPDSIPKEVIVETVTNHLYTEEGLHDFCHQSSFIEIDWFVGKFKEIPEANRIRVFEVHRTDEKQEFLEEGLQVAKDTMIDMFINLYENYQNNQERFFKLNN